MRHPVQYDHGDPSVFGGAIPNPPDFERARIVVLPIPFDRTTSYVPGTRNGPREIIQASSHMELWDEELESDVLHEAGIFTLPEMELPFGEMEPALAEIERVASEILGQEKFLVALGGEHSITPPLVAAAARRHRGLHVLQIDAHADLRDSYMGTPHNHACAMRRVLEHVPATQVAIRSLSADEAEVLASLKTTVFFDHDMRRETDWVDRIVATLGDPVYITVDVDGLDPAIMPSTGTPEPGGLSWYEALALLRAVFAGRTVVACDLVELSPLPPLVAPNFLCAKLVYKMLGYRFARRAGGR
ncbi:MAG TPA: agmatinase [Vicinamibacterales bacterium]|nr:agmatinase [Vicinamibacterales bacterium]